MAATHSVAEITFRHQQHRGGEHRLEEDHCRYDKRIFKMGLNRNFVALCAGVALWSDDPVTGQELLTAPRNYVRNGTEEKWRVPHRYG